VERTHTSERDTSEERGRVLSKCLLELNRSTGSWHRLVSFWGGVGGPVQRERLVEEALVLYIQTLDARSWSVPYATLERVLMNSPAYPVTTKSSSQKLRHISCQHHLLNRGSLTSTWRSFRQRQAGTVEWCMVLRVASWAVLRCALDTLLC
jgi:hypothetical protein